MGIGSARLGRVWKSLNDYAAEVIVPTLGEHRDDYDENLLGAAAELTMWINSSQCFHEKSLSPAAFWMVLDRYESCLDSLRTAIGSYAKYLKADLTKTFDYDDQMEIIPGTMRLSFLGEEVDLDTWYALETLFVILIGASDSHTSVDVFRSAVRAARASVSRAAPILAAIDHIDGIIATWMEEN